MVREEKEEVNIEHARGVQASNLSAMADNRTFNIEHRMEEKEEMKRIHEGVDGEEVDKSKFSSIQL